MALSTTMSMTPSFFGTVFRRAPHDASGAPRFSSRSPAGSRRDLPKQRSGHLACAEVVFAVHPLWKIDIARGHCGTHSGRPAGPSRSGNALELVHDAGRNGVRFRQQPFVFHLLGEPLLLVASTVSEKLRFLPINLGKPRGL